MLIALPQLFSKSTQLSGVVGIVAQGGNMIGGSFVMDFIFLPLLVRI